MSTSSKIAQGVFGEHAELKERVATGNEGFIEQFIRENMYQVDGKTILFKEFCEAFRNWVILLTEEDFSAARIRDSLPTYVAFGASSHTNQRFVGNISFEPKDPDAAEIPKVIVKDNKLWRDGKKI